MDTVFTLSYPEYATAEALAKHLPKREGYAVSIPLSRQQKGFDLLVFHSSSPTSTSKAATIQVKSSRVYPGRPPRRATSPRKFNYNLWFNRFDYKEREADFYILFGCTPRALSVACGAPGNQATGGITKCSCSANGR